MFLQHKLNCQEASYSHCRSHTSPCRPGEQQGRATSGASTEKSYVTERDSQSETVGACTMKITEISLNAGPIQPYKQLRRWWTWCQARAEMQWWCAVPSFLTAAKADAQKVGNTTSTRTVSYCNRAQRLKVQHVVTCLYFHLLIHRG